MSAREWARWEAGELDEPIPDLVHMLAQIACNIYNANRGNGKKAAKVEQFIPRKVKVKRKQSLDDGQSADEARSIVRGAMARTAIRQGVI